MLLIIAFYPPMLCRRFFPSLILLLLFHLKVLWMLKKEYLDFLRVLTWKIPLYGDHMAYGLPSKACAGNFLEAINVSSRDSILVVVVVVVVVVTVTLLMVLGGTGGRGVCIFST